MKRFELFMITINQIYRSIQKLKNREMEKMGLKGTDIMCLLNLSRHEDGLTSAELCTLCVEDKAAISRAVSALMKNGMVVFLEPENHRYRAKLVLTEKGREVSERLLAYIGTAVTKSGDGLTEEEREVFYKALGKISDNLQQLCRQDDGL